MLTWQCIKYYGNYMTWSVRTALKEMRIRSLTLKAQTPSLLRFYLLSWIYTFNGPTSDLCWLAVTSGPLLAFSVRSSLQVTPSLLLLFGPTCRSKDAGHILFSSPAGFRFHPCPRCPRAFAPLLPRRLVPSSVPSCCCLRGHLRCACWLSS